MTTCSCSRTPSLAESTPSVAAPLTCRASLERERRTMINKRLRRLQDLISYMDKELGRSSTYANGGSDTAPWIGKKASSDIKKVQLGSSGSAPFKNKNLAEALHMQMEVQTQLHEQL